MYRTDDLISMEKKTKELEDKLMLADWDDVISIQTELESYRKKMEKGELYEPRF